MVSGSAVNRMSTKKIMVTAFVCVVGRIIMSEVVQLFDKTRVMAKCLLCGDTDACLVDTHSWREYTGDRSRLVQELFPDEDTWTREILIAGRLSLGITDRCSLYMCEKCCIEWEE